MRLGILLKGGLKLQGERAVAIFANHAPPPKLTGIVEAVDIEDCCKKKLHSTNPDGD